MLSVPSCQPFATQSKSLYRQSLRFTPAQVTNYILSTSLGNHCAEGLPYTNPFDCPATCTYDPQRSNRPFCPVPDASQVPALLSDSTCKTRRPCKVPATATAQQVEDAYEDKRFTGANTHPRPPRYTKALFPARHRAPQPRIATPR